MILKISHGDFYEAGGDYYSVEDYVADKYPGHSVYWKIFNLYDLVWVVVLSKDIFLGGGEYDCC